MASIETLLGLHQGGDQKALADRLRGQAAGANVLSLSTIPQVAAMGDAQRRQAIAAATRGGALNEALKAREESARRWEADNLESARRWDAQQKESLRRFNIQEARAQRQDAALGAAEAFIDRETGKTTYLQRNAAGQYFNPDGTPADLSRYTNVPKGRKGSTKAYMDGEGNILHMQQLPDGTWVDSTNTVRPEGLQGLKPYSVSAETAARGQKPPAKMESAANETTNIVQRIQRATSLLANMDEADMEELNKPLAEVALGMMPDDWATYVKDKHVFTRPKVKEYRTRMADIEATLSRLAAGLNVTGFEIQARKLWSPFAPGLSLESRDARTRILNEKMHDAIDIYNKQYPGYAVEKPDFYAAFGVERPAPPDEDTVDQQEDTADVAPPSAEEGIAPPPTPIPYDLGGEITRSPVGTVLTDPATGKKFRKVIDGPDEDGSRWEQYHGDPSRATPIYAAPPLPEG